MARQVLQVSLRSEAMGEWLPMFLPLSIVNAYGQVFGEGIVSSTGEVGIEYERAEEPLYARLILPSGNRRTEALQSVGGQWRDGVVFDEEDILSDWRVKDGGNSAVDSVTKYLSLFGHQGLRDAWIQLWERDGNGRWRQISAESEMFTLGSSVGAIRFEIRRGWGRALVFQIGDHPPQVVSLPSFIHRSPLVVSVRVPPGGTPQLMVNGYGANAEVIMDFLRLGEMGAVATMLDPRSELADELFRDKELDPVAATAAAYYLLRKRDWDRLPSKWLDGLADNFIDLIPDLGLIRSVASIERGMQMSEASRLAADALLRLQERGGLPLFAEAYSLLRDLFAFAGGEMWWDGKPVGNSLRRVLAAAHPVGVSFGYLGYSPGRPTPNRRAGDWDGKRSVISALAERVRPVGTFEGFDRSFPQLGFDDDRSPQQVRRMMESRRRSVDLFLEGPRPQVPGSAERTIFLNDVLNELSMFRS